MDWMTPVAFLAGGLIMGVAWADVLRDKWRLQEYIRLHLPYKCGDCGHKPCRQLWGLKGPCGYAERIFQQER